MRLNIAPLVVLFTACASGPKPVTPTSTAPDREVIIVVDVSRTMVETYFKVRDQLVAFRQALHSGAVQPQATVKVALGIGEMAVRTETWHELGQHNLEDPGSQGKILEALYDYRPGPTESPAEDALLDTAAGLANPAKETLVVLLKGTTENAFDPHYSWQRFQKRHPQVHLIMVEVVRDRAACGKTQLPLIHFCEAAGNVAQGLQKIATWWR